MAGEAASACAAPIAYEAGSAMARVAASSPVLAIDQLQSQIVSVKQALKRAQAQKKLDRCNKRH